MIAAAHVGVSPADAISALGEFRGVRRRLEKRGDFGGIVVYEDFAHHPTAIATTLAGLRSRSPEGRLVAVVEPRSNTMRMGVHGAALARAFDDADRVFVLASPQSSIGIRPRCLAPLGAKLSVGADVAALLGALLEDLRAGDQVVLDVQRWFSGSAGAARAGARGPLTVRRVDS